MMANFHTFYPHIQIYMRASVYACVDDTDTKSGLMTVKKFAVEILNGKVSNEQKENYNYLKHIRIYACKYVWKCLYVN